VSNIEETIQVNVPVSTAYNQWTQFEEFPRFMEGVKKVTQVDAKRLHWEAEIAGVEREWDAEIIDQVPDSQITWRATGGTRNDGVVTFRPVGNDKTEVRLRLDMDPKGFLENVADKLGFIKTRAGGDLKRFKEYIESRGAETGAWRGEIKPGEAYPTDPGGSATTTGQTGQPTRAGTTRRTTDTGSI
jgi:uncharacterized membrane protein